MRFRIGMSAILAGVSMFGIATGVQKASAEDKPAAGSQTVVGDPYPLDTCPVSGEKLGGMGDPVIKVYEGREVRFCCKGCVSKLEKDPEAMFKKIDEKIVEQQKASYPLDTCVVSGDKLGASPTTFVFGNRLFLLCCKDCEDAVKKEPAKFFEKLDNAVKEKQGASYALKTCPVSGKAIEGKGVEHVAANHLIRFCCEGCIKQFDKEPTKYLSMLDKPGEAKTN
ncbi:MAG: hypothetical protein K1Y02_12825 [Candidatus Hydrogenedentes bacterium]|nr:hypothetical protein [Candidatus Hydrogenedentota bacterium]